VDQDFVEAPSQMLENWVFSEEILSLISSNYSDSSKKLPLEILKSLKESRDFNQGSFYMRQLFFGLLDLRYHTAEGPVDVTDTYRRLYKDILTIDPIEGSHFPASFGHLMGGYDAGYYGYLWSQVFSEDLFTKFEKENLLSAKVGSAYRKSILEKGKMQDASELLFQFLGRAPSTEAFYQRLGIH
jgi:Zn-dependent oligopeptidase